MASQGLLLPTAQTALRTCSASAFSSVGSKKLQNSFSCNLLSRTLPWESQAATPAAITRRVEVVRCSLLWGSRHPLRVTAVAAAPSETAVAQEVEFTWQGEAGKVFLTGSFAEWEKKIPLAKTAKGRFSTKEKLEPGNYEYKFIVDGEWVHSPDAPTAPDGAGGFNNVVEVKAPAAAKSQFTTPSNSEAATPAGASQAKGSSETSDRKPAEKIAAEAPKAAAPAAKAAAPAAKPAPKAGKAGGKKGAKAAAKPLPELMAEDIIPQLIEELTKENVTDIELVFEDNQLRGSFVNAGVPYCFWCYFPDGNLEGSRGFSLTSHGAIPSTVEPFFIDERRMTPDMLVFWVSKRLFAQKTALPKLN